MFGRKKRYRSPDEKIVEAWLWIILGGLVIGSLFIIGALWIIWQTLDTIGLL